MIDPPSRSAQKRAAESAQALGVRLAELTPERLDGLPIPDRLRAAIDEYRRITSHPARKRQRQFIGRLMRDVDADAIREALDSLDRTSARDRAAFHDTEAWRDRLLREPAARDEWLARHPGVARADVERLIKAATAARDETARRRQARALFRLLRAEAPSDPDPSPG
jgi:ribosome-associated protein